VAWGDYDRERLAAAGIFFIAAGVVFVAGLFESRTSVPLLPVAVGGILLAMAHPTAVASREESRAERAEILAELEARDAERTPRR
jgi:hypothetical protein